MKVTVLMIDDHPPIIEGYKSILSFNPYGYAVATTSAHSCEMAYEVITTTETFFDIVFLDITLPPYPEKQLYSGQDIIALVRHYLPKSKIVILTSHTEALFLHNLLETHKPDGFILKNDVLTEEFIVAFDVIIKGGTYYSNTIKNLNIKSETTNKLLDSYNIQIIEMLARGIKSKTIQEQLHLSKSAIDKRKVAIKFYLGIEKGNDETILKEARKKGLI